MGDAYAGIRERRYRVLRRLEEQMDASGDSESLARIQEELERVGEEIRRIHVPASYGANLFALRVHHRMLLERIEYLKQRDPGS